MTNNFYSVFNKALLLGTLALFSPMLTCGLEATTAHRANVAPTIDGYGDDAVWQGLDWHPITYSLLGDEPRPSDFSGRFKVAWKKSEIYVLAEIVDDVLIDSNADPFVRYWEDDTFEIFIDADASGGNHHQNHSAFAYHFALDGQVVDIGTEGHPIDVTHHAKSEWRRARDSDTNKLYWEVAIQVFSENYDETSSENSLQPLNEGDVLGFMVAYCDADSANGREHFMNSVDIAPRNGDKNLGYLTADVFGKLALSAKQP